MADKKVAKETTETGVVFKFASGETVEVKAADFNSAIQKQLLVHGISQKLGDSYSGEDTDKCHSAFQGVLKNLLEGKWSDRSGGGGARISNLAEALSRATGKDVQVCVEKLAGMDDDEKKAVKAHPDVISAMADIKLEKAKAEAARIQKELAESGDVKPLNF